MNRPSGVSCFQNTLDCMSESQALAGGIPDDCVHKGTLIKTKTGGRAGESQVATCTVEAATIQARCSVKSIHETISRLDEAKRNLVESIGFGGLLRFPLIRSTNKRFSAWLISKVDVPTSSIVLGNGKRLTFSSKDISTVFGIPSGGRKVVEAGHLNREGKDRMKSRFWPLMGKEQRSIRAVQELLEKNYEHSMTPDEEDTFKVAFVVYVMSTLFVPAAKHDYVCADNWAALTEPSCIHLYDWADYVHGKLLASVTKFKMDTLSGCPSPNITGCYIFLQVFYLDNIDLGQLNMDHSVIPRITCFPNERLRSMIGSISSIRPGTNSHCEFGKAEEHPREHTCYTRSSEPMDGCSYGHACGQISLWEASVNMAKVLRLPIESAGPLFLAVCELEKKAGPGTGKYGIECINVLLNIMRPFVGGYRYEFGLHHEDNGSVGWASMPPQLYCNCCCKTDCCQRLVNVDYGSTSTASHDTCSIGEPGGCVDLQVADAGSVGCRDVLRSKRRYSTVGQPHMESSKKKWKNWCSCNSMQEIDCSVMKAMSQFYLLVRRMRAHKQIDLNTGVSCEEPCQRAGASRDVVLGAVAKSPWQLGGLWDYRQQPARPLSTLLARSADASCTDRPSVVDYYPKYIEVMPIAALNQANGVSEMEMDVFDAIIRTFAQDDDKLYMTEGRVRWRHFFESDVVASIIAGWFDKDNPSISNQFIGSHLNYDICNCRILFFPFILHDRWVCFAWDLKLNRITVFDPASINIHGVNIHGVRENSVYTHIVEKLMDVLASTFEELFTGWQHNWRAAVVVPFIWRNAGTQCWNRTGVLSAYFCRYFNGDELLPDIEMGGVGRVAAVLFDRMARLQEHRASFRSRRDVWDKL